MYRRILLITIVATLAMLALAGCSQESTSETSSTEESPQAESSNDQDAATEEDGMMRLTSRAFDDGGTIPVQYCSSGVDGGENVSVPFDWSGQPAGAQSYALIMVDHHEVANEWVHWIVIDIPAETASLAEGASGSSMPAGSKELLSTSGAAGYQGPEPPPGSGDHEYEAMLFALDVETVEVAEDATYEEFLAAVEPHAIGEAALSGFFGR